MDRINDMGCAEGYIRAVTDFVFVRDELQHADVIFLPGSADP
ncbi:MAG: hypothetical protein Q4C54_03475 [Clostridia bacterium]|nr:hypothetical protein [Clostridia bacterium]